MLSTTLLLAASMVVGQASDTAPGTVSMPKEVVDEFSYFEGNWSLEGDETKASSLWSFSWAPGKHCLLVEYRRKEQGKVILGNGLLGWDSVSKEIVYTGMYSDPGLECIRAKLDEPGVLKGSYSLSLEGKKTDASWELCKEGQDEYRVKITDQDDACFKRVASER